MEPTLFEATVEATTDDAARGASRSGPVIRATALPSAAPPGP